MEDTQPIAETVAEEDIEHNPTFQRVMMGAVMTEDLRQGTGDNFILGSKHSTRCNGMDNLQLDAIVRTTALQASLNNDQTKHAELGGIFANETLRQEA